MLPLLAAVLCCGVAVSSADRSFTIGNRTLLKDGRPFQIVSGSLHYMRVPADQWGDRLQKMAAAGLNAVQVYVPWNWHEPREGEFRWDGGRNLTALLQLAADADLLVVLRPGPYVCAEWDGGGFPYWLRRHNVTLRVSDPAYLALVDAWFAELLPRVAPFLYAAGGPVVMSQIENEYGFYACDHAYMQHLHDVMRKHLGDDVVLHTTDPPNVVQCGSLPLPDVLTTVDFGFTWDVNEAFALQRKYKPDTPLYNSECAAPARAGASARAHAPPQVLHGVAGPLGRQAPRADGEPHRGPRHAAAVDGRVDQPVHGRGQHQLCVLQRRQHGQLGGGVPDHGDQVSSGVGGADGRAAGSRAGSYDYDAPLSEAGDMTYKYSVLSRALAEFHSATAFAHASDSYRAMRSGAVAAPRNSTGADPSGAEDTSRTPVTRPSVTSSPSARTPSIT